MKESPEMKILKNMNFQTYFESQKTIVSLALGHFPTQ